MMMTFIIAVAVAITIAVTITVTVTVTVAVLVIWRCISHFQLSFIMAVGRGWRDDKTRGWRSDLISLRFGHCFGPSRSIGLSACKGRRGGCTKEINNKNSLNIG